MSKTKYFLSILVLTLLAVSCAKEDIAPNLEQDVSEKTLTTNPEAYAQFFELEEGLLMDDQAILQALNVEQTASSRATTLPFIYTMTNEASGNEVWAYSGQSTGTITRLGKYPTEGKGTDSGLGNQGALALNYNQTLLYVTNPGSNEISFFTVCIDGELKFVNKVHSGGVRPVSVTSHRGLVYVLNAGSDNIAGFSHNQFGKLVPLSNSTRPLSGTGVGAAQISFSPNGRALVITEKATNTITSYRMQNMGRPFAMPHTFSSAGMTPFGFAFVWNNIFHVSEAAGGADGASTVSSYKVGTQGMVSLVSGPFATNATAACWVAVSNDPRTLYVTNTGSNDISSLSAAYSGKLSFANGGNTTSTGGGPIDAATDSQSKYLYVLSSGADAIYTYSIGMNGALSQIDRDWGLPEYASGLAVKDH